MPANISGASAPHHVPIDRAAFLSIRLTRDPDEAYCLVVGKLGELSDPAEALARCSELIGGHGVEALTLADGSELLYVNMGDTYDSTLCHVAGRGFFVSSWGDVYEEADREREEQEGERRCAYCSEWCECDPAAGAQEPCGSCGRDPATGDPWPEALRHVRLDSGHTLRTWDTGKASGRGMMARTRIGYELCEPTGKVLFRGDDFGPGAATADDSDEALRGLLGFLFLRPGDTDRDYFASYTAEQLAFAASPECEQLQWLYSEEGDGRFVDLDDDSDEGGAS